MDTYVFLYREQRNLTEKCYGVQILQKLTNFDRSHYTHPYDILWGAPSWFTRRGGIRSPIITIVYNEVSA